MVIIHFAVEKTIRYDYYFMGGERDSLLLMWLADRFVALVVVVVVVVNSDLL